MFERWRQENFFKYLRQEYALDALVQYAAVPDDPTREVPNPVWAATDAQLRQAHAHLARLQAEYGLEALTNLEDQRRTMRGFKTAQGKLGQKIWNAWQRVLQLEKRRAAMPCRVPVQAVTAKLLEDLAARLSRRVQLSSDGLDAYPDAIERGFGSEVDCGQPVKTYGLVKLNKDAASRYSPAEVGKMEAGIEKSQGTAAEQLQRCGESGALSKNLLDYQRKSVYARGQHEVSAV